MHKILEKRQYSPEVFYLRVEAPEIAKNRHPGQFVIQAVGATTIKLCNKNVGDSIAAILGPLGRPSHITKCGTVACVCGGIGVAPMYPIAQAFKEAGNKLIVIIGARNKDLIVFEDEMKAIADELIITTDDGSYGRKALVTVPLKELCESQTPPDEVFAIGPPIMMKFCAETTRPFGIKTTVSLNTIMIDGTGMCGGCRVTVDNQIKFVCVDGPEFDAHKVDFDNMMMRMKAFRGREDQDRHKCKSGIFN